MCRITSGRTSLEDAAAFQNFPLRFTRRRDLLSGKRRVAPPGASRLPFPERVANKIEYRRFPPPSARRGGALKAAMSNSAGYILFRESPVSSVFPSYLGILFLLKQNIRLVGFSGNASRSPLNGSRAPFSRGVMMPESGQEKTERPRQETGGMFSQRRTMFQEMKHAAPVIFIFCGIRPASTE